MSVTTPKGAELAVPGAVPFATARAEVAEDRARASTRGLIRGSALLLAGRVLSRGTNFLIQILTVRYLSMSDYGAFAYALSIVTLGQALATFGLDRAITRFIPLYQERGDYPRVAGTLAMVVAVIVSLGLVIAVGFQLAASRGHVVGTAETTALLVILIFLVPLQALDDLIIALFAVFADPRAIFVRRHVLAPSLKLAVVVALLLSGSSVAFLAAGYLAASLVGVTAYLLVLVKAMRAHGLLAQLSLRRLCIPAAELLAFTMPLLMSNLVFIAIHLVTVLLLEHYRGLHDVAMYRAQQPFAAINQAVMVSFATLFTPLATRLFARDERQAVNELYWRTAMWIAVLSFPIFALTCSLAVPSTRLLLGARYEDSAILLALLSWGYYFNAALGFNGLTLKIYGRLRYVVVICLATVVVSLVASLVLIPAYGVVGAAVATCVAMVVHNVFKQVGLRLGTGIDIFDWRYLRGYLVIVFCATALWLIEWAAQLPAYASLILAGAASTAVFMANRRLLEVADTFPEMLRWPLIRRVMKLAKAV
jgi:O-antigen/teichoic acid export membrane protein